MGLSQKLFKTISFFHIYEKFVTSLCPLTLKMKFKRIRKNKARHIKAQSTLSFTKLNTCYSQYKTSGKAKWKNGNHIRIIIISELDKLINHSYHFYHWLAIILIIFGSGHQNIIYRKDEDLPIYIKVALCDI